MINQKNDFLIVNGVKFPMPDYGFTVDTSQAVDGARNASNAFIGQKVGRRIWKLDGLKFSNVTVEQWTEMREALDDFTVPVTFTGDDNVRHTIHFYPSDLKATPARVDDELMYTMFDSVSFNLVDCGWDE